MLRQRSREFFRQRGSAQRSTAAATSEAGDFLSRLEQAEQRDSRTSAPAAAERLSDAERARAAVEAKVAA